MENGKQRRYGIDPETDLALLKALKADSGYYWNGRVMDCYRRSAVDFVLSALRMQRQGSAIEKMQQTRSEFKEVFENVLPNYMESKHFENIAEKALEAGADYCEWPLCENADCKAEREKKAASEASEADPLHLQIEMLFCNSGAAMPEFIEAFAILLERYACMRSEMAENTSAGEDVLSGYRDIAHRVYGEIANANRLEVIADESAEPLPPVERCKALLRSADFLTFLEDRDIEAFNIVNIAGNAGMVHLLNHLNESGLAVIGRAEALYQEFRKAK